MMKTITKTFLLFCGFLLCTAFGGTITVQSARAEELGTLYGTVSFVGIPCAPDKRRGPPCDGPYPGYEVVVYKAGTLEIAARTRTDVSGRYEVELPPGNYILRSPVGGPTVKQKTEESSPSRVEAGGRTRLDLRIDTGMR